MSTGRVLLADKTNVDIFMNKVEDKVGSGEKTIFWLSRWIGDKPLMEEFPEVYAKTVNKFGRVCEIWKNDPSVWKWDLGISSEVFLSMNGIAARQSKELEDIIEEMRLDKNNKIPSCGGQNTMESSQPSPSMTELEKKLRGQIFYRRNKHKP